MTSDESREGEARGIFPLIQCRHYLARAEAMRQRERGRMRRNSTIKEGQRSFVLRCHRSPEEKMSHVKAETRDPSRQSRSETQSMESAVIRQAVM